MNAYLSLIEKGRGGRLLTFSTFRMGAYSSWALIRGWALIRINTVDPKAISNLRKLTTVFFSFSAVSVFVHPS